MPPLPESIRQALMPLARRYVWWKSPEEALEFPAHAIAHIMNLATLEDMRLLEDTVGPARLAQTLAESEAGWLTGPSWHFWHYCLHLCAPGDVPPLPTRRLPP